jgi:tetratricopeptide (TPR) repeat protein
VWRILRLALFSRRAAAETTDKHREKTLQTSVYPWFHNKLWRGSKEVCETATHRLLTLQPTRLQSKRTNMKVSAKDREYIRNYGKTKSVRQLARELGLTKAKVREALKELEQKDELRDEPLPAPLPIFDEKRPLSKSDYLWAVFTALLSSGVYLLTVAPDLTGEDSGELITAAYTLGICHPPGYPLWCILGKLFTIIIPFGTIAYRVNFMSVFFAAWTIFFLFLVIRKITGNRVIAAASALVFAFSYEFWSQTTIAEVYTLDTFFVTASLLTLIVWDEKRSKQLLYVLALLCGLGCTNHHTMAPISLVFAGYVLLKARRGQINLKVAGICVLLFTAMLSVYLYLPIRARANPYMNWGNPQTLTRMGNHILRKQYEVPQAEKETNLEYQRSWQRFGKQMGVYLQAYVRQFTYLLFYLPLLGLWVHFRKKKLEFSFLLAIFLLTSIGFVLFSNFPVTREQIIGNDFLFIPSYMVSTIWLSIGLLYLWKALLKKVAQSAVPIAASILTFSLPVINLFANYYENNKREYYFAVDYGNAAFDTMEKNAIILPKGDHRRFSLLYLQGVLGMRKDVTIASKYGYIEENLYSGLVAEKGKTGGSAETIPVSEKEKYIILNNQNRPIYFTERRTLSDLNGFLMVPEGLLFRIIREADLPKYSKKVSEEYWKRYTFRNLDDPRVARDYSVDLITFDYHYMRAQSYLEEGRTKQAIEEVERLKKPAEGLKEVFNNVGSMLAEHGLLKEAVIFFEKALYCDPNFLVATQNMAKAYLLLKDYQTGLKYLNRALEIKPNDFDTHIALAQMYMEKKEFDSAIIQLENLTIRFPQQFLPYRILGFIYRDGKKDANKAFELFQKSLELNPNQPDLNGLLQQMKK